MKYIGIYKVLYEILEKYFEDLKGLSFVFIENIGVNNGIIFNEEKLDNIIIEGKLEVLFRFNTKIFDEDELIATFEFILEKEGKDYKLGLIYKGAKYRENTVKDTALILDTNGKLVDFFRNTDIEDLAQYFLEEKTEKGDTKWNH